MIRLIPLGRNVVVVFTRAIEKVSRFLALGGISWFGRTALSMQT